jgi:Zn-dependent protease with chaperone function
MKPVSAAGRLVLLAVVAALAFAQASWCASQKSEESMGRQYSEQFEKDAKLVTDKQVIERVERIGQALAKIANSYEVPAYYGTSNIIKFKYQFKVVEDEDVNAMSLPGGIIYVNTGLLDLVESDDELAGVLAHEIAHAAHHHMSQLLKKSSAVDRYVALIALAGILGNARARDMNNLMMGAQMLSIGKMSGYTLQAERDADKTAVAYMAKSSYNPDGLVTFMNKLQNKHASNPSAPLGIFMDHPSPYRRAESITKAMEELGLKSDVRKLRNVAYAKAEPVPEDKSHYRVVICDRVVCQPASIAGGQSSKDRANKIAADVNAALDAGISCRDLVCDTSGQCLETKKARLVTVDPQDSALAGKTPAQLLAQARSALEFAIWAEWLSKCNSRETEAENP